MEPDNDVPRAKHAVRSFMVTKGRASAPEAKSDLALETLVETTKKGAASLTSLTFEHRRIVELLDERMSVAEVSAHLKLPLLSTLVLLGTLIQDGHVEAGTPSAELDIGMLISIRDALVKL